MNRRIPLTRAFIALPVAALLAAGCAAARSPLVGGFDGEPVPAETAAPVSVAFLFTHTHQNRGWDVIPKLHHQDRYATGFYDFFRVALSTLTNVGPYSTFIDRSDDVTQPGRRAERDSLAVGSHDFTVRMHFMRETSFPRQVFATMGSAATLTLVPVPRTRRYSLAAEVSDRSGRVLKTYDRSATVTLWVHFSLIAAYPFFPEARKTDELYLEFLTDLFREMEADGILVFALPSTG